MKSILIAAALTLLFASGSLLQAGSPGLMKGVMVDSNGSPISVAQSSAVTTVDWNNDGKKDLIVGSGSGYVWFFANTGTDIDPAFNCAVQIKSNGTPIVVNYASG